MEDYQCIATNELLPRRLNVQRINHKCKYDSGYIAGDITSDEVKQRIYDEIRQWEKRGNDRVDVVVATPPCQGISVINHKKNSKEINRNSLVVESVEIITKIKPRFFIFENVMAFQKTLCISHDNRTMPIGEYIRNSGFGLYHFGKSSELHELWIQFITYAYFGNWSRQKIQEQYYSV